MFASASITPVVIYILHLGPKPSIMASAALILVGNWIRFAGAHSGSGGLFGVVMFGQILLGLAQPFVLAAPTRYSDLWFTNRGRVAATALTSLANPLGAALGQLVVPLWVTQPSEVSSMLLYVSVIVSPPPSILNVNHGTHRNRGTPPVLRLRHPLLLHPRRPSNPGCSLGRDPQDVPSGLSQSPL